MPFTPHPDYSRYAVQWQRCRDTSEGEDAVKAQGQVYLPRLEGRKNSQKGSKDYDDYLMRASFFGATGRTVIGLTGAVMRKPPQVEGTPIAEAEPGAAEIVATETSVGFAGESLVAMIHTSVNQVLEVGRVGHLVDALPADQSADGVVVPYVVEYITEDILAWDEKVVHGKKSLVWVVLREGKSMPDPDPTTGFAMVSKVQYRVLRIVDQVPTSDSIEDLLFRGDDFDNGAIYIQEVWEDVEVERKPGHKAEELVLVERIVPRGQNGAAFKEIPFRFTNWNGSSPAVSKPPLIDLASVNISHYRNSADIEHGRHYTALPTPWAAGFALEGQELEIGSKTAWISENANAKADMLEFTGAGLGHLAEGMVQKEAQMAVLGARLLEESRPAVETAEAVKLRQSGDRSVLAGITRSISGTWTWALNTLWDWTNTVKPPESISVTVNTDFASAQMSPLQLNSLVAALQGQTISWDTFVENLQRGEVISTKVTAEEEAERIAAGNPSATLGSSSFNEPFPEPEPAIPPTEPTPETPPAETE